MKVLLFSNDLMPFGDLPTSGGGLRCFQLMKGLEAHGIKVVASMPGFTYLAEKHFQSIPLEQRELLWHWGTQDEIFERTKPDAVLFASNWDHFNITKSLDVPLIIDLHGSRLIETTMWNNPVSTDHKVRIFSAADCFLCAGRKQRNYFYGWLVQAGRVPADEHFIRYIPVSLSPDQPEHFYPTSEDTSTPRFVSGGGWFPWQNQAKTIFAVCRAAAERDRGNVEIFGTPHETQNMSPDELPIRDIYAQVKGLAEQSPRVKVHGYIGRDALIEIYQHASVAVEAMQYNLERELAFTTRTIEYLWCGLPVIYNNFGEISEHIRDYDAGWTIDPASDEQIAEVIDEIFANPALVEQKSKNAKQLVRDRFSWDKTIQPLVDFLYAPVKACAAQPAVGPLCTRASFLSPVGTAVDIPLEVGGASYAQVFTVPAENIKSIEVALALTDRTQDGGISGVRLKLKSKNKRLLAQKKICSADLPVNGKISIDFPLLQRPKGGAEYIFEISCVGEKKSNRAVDKNGVTAPVILRGFVESPYPLRDSTGVGFGGRTLLGEPVRAKSLALSFVPGGGRFYHLKSLAQRVLWMIRNGEWRRLLHAAKKRMPGLAYRLRRLAFG
jgi:glycosyltransferase involved in cell wall biosynthesis